MERKVNEVFKDLKGKNLKVVKSNLTCTGCFYYRDKNCVRTSDDILISGSCNPMLRQDDNYVIFKEENRQ